ncbi:MAG: hypothetical protein AB7S26_07705 [Sandaracinaceae bacterium]
MRRAATFASWIVLALGCAGPPAEVPVRRELYFALERLSLDPSTQLAEWVRNEPSAQPIVAGFDALGCETDPLLALRIDAELTSAGGFGALTGLVVTAREGDPCDGGSLVIQPISYRDPNATPPIPQLEGPVSIDGLTLDARLNIGEFEVGGYALSVVPRWWQISGRFEGLDPSDFESVIELRDLHADTTWTIRQLGEQVIPSENLNGYPEGTVSLSVLVASDYDPDDDVDGDGYERVELEIPHTVSPIARCIDGDGTVIEGPSCIHDPRIVDGYEARLILRATQSVDVR